MREKKLVDLGFEVISLRLNEKFIFVVKCVAIDIT